MAVLTDVPQARDYSMPIEAIGTTHARHSVLVTSRVSGRVSRIFLTAGARADAGAPQVLLEDDTERANLRSAAATVAEVTSQFQRLESLAARGLVSRYDLERQQRAVETARAELQLRQVLFDQRTIRAPFAGVVGFRQVSVGTPIQPGHEHREPRCMRRDARPVLRAREDDEQRAAQRQGRGRDCRIFGAHLHGTHRDARHANR